MVRLGWQWEFQCNRVGAACVAVRCGGCVCSEGWRRDRHMCLPSWHRINQGSIGTLAEEHGKYDGVKFTGISHFISFLLFLSRLTLHPVYALFFFPFMAIYSRCCCCCVCVKNSGPISQTITPSYPPRL